MNLSQAGGKRVFNSNRRRDITQVVLESTCFCVYNWIGVEAHVNSVQLVNFFLDEFLYGDDIVAVCEDDTELFPGVQGTIKIQGSRQDRNRARRKSGKNIYNFLDEPLESDSQSLTKFSSRRLTEWGCNFVLLESRQWLIWEEASRKICWLGASIETPGVLLNTYHEYVQLCWEFGKGPSLCRALYWIFTTLVHFSFPQVQSGLCLILGDTVTVCLGQKTI